MTDNIDKLIESISEEYGNVNGENIKPKKKEVVPPKEKQAPIHNKKSTEYLANPKIVNKESAGNAQRNFRSSIERQQAKVTNKKPTAFRKMMKIVFDILFYAFVILLIAGSALFALNGSQQKDFLGFRVYTVRTNSMLTDGSEYKDGFAAGDMIVVKKASFEELQPGEIVTYVPGEDSKEYVTHRLVEKMTSLNGEEGKFVLTKGDANKVNDSPFNADLVFGKKVFAIPAIGPIIVFIRENWVVSLVAIVSFFGFIFALKHYFSKEEL